MWILHTGHRTGRRFIAHSLQHTTWICKVRTELPVLAPCRLRSRQHPLTDRFDVLSKRYAAGQQKRTLRQPACFQRVCLEWAVANDCFFPVRLSTNICNSPLCVRKLCSATRYSICLRSPLAIRLSAAAMRRSATEMRRSASKNTQVTFGCPDVCLCYSFVCGQLKGLKAYYFEQSWVKVFWGYTVLMLCLWFSFSIGSYTTPQGVIFDPTGGHFRPHMG